MALGYSQVPIINFEINYLPVVNNVSFCILLVFILINGWYLEILDIQTAFLHSKLKKEIYIAEFRLLGKKTGFATIQVVYGSSFN